MNLDNRKAALTESGNPKILEVDTSIIADLPSLRMLFAPVEGRHVPARNRYCSTLRTTLVWGTPYAELSVEDQLTAWEYFTLGMTYQAAQDAATQPPDTDSVFRAGMAWEARRAALEADSETVESDREFRRWVASGDWIPYDALSERRSDTEHTEAIRAYWEAVGFDAA